MAGVKAGQTVEICSQRAEYGGLYVIKVLSNKRKVYLSELDGCTAKVIYPHSSGGFVVEVNSEERGRAGRVTLPAEVLKPVKAEPPKAQA